MGIWEGKSFYCKGVTEYKKPPDNMQDILNELAAAAFGLLFAVLGETPISYVAINFCI